MSDLVLDHVGVAVRDLAAAREEYARLGFAPTPLSVHAAPPSPGAAPEPTGSGNHCVMLRGGYIELLGLTDADKLSGARAMLERYEGAHILALGSRDVARARSRIAGLGFPIAEPVSLERDAPWGPGARETRRAAFANAHLDRAVFPEARAFVIEHRTPEVVWQPHQLDHPNGALALTEAWILAGDPRAAAERYACLAGARHESVGPGEWSVPLSRGKLRVLGPDSAPARIGAAWPGPHDALVGFAVAVGAPARTAALLRDNAVPFEAVEGGLRVPPAAAHGTAILFTPEA